MSGSGGTIYTPEPPTRSCDKLTFKTVLNSPNPAVIKLLSERDILSITVTKQYGYDVIQAIFNGQVAGSITSDFAPRLLDCMGEGNDYVAVVLAVNNGRVDVEVRRAVSI